MRNPPAAEILNEEVSNLLKRKIKGSLARLDELSIAFDYDGEVTAQDAQEILEKIQRLHAQALAAAETASSPERVGHCGYSRPICTRPSMRSSQTSFNTISCESWTTW
jgi:hypothetical protein